jgi:hypoxia up-regulated 1
VSTEEQRQEIVTMSNEAEEWLYEDGRNADVTEYTAKQGAIRKKAEAIFTRYSELKERPEAVKKALAALEDVRGKVATWADKMPQVCSC